MGNSGQEVNHLWVDLLWLITLQMCEFPPFPVSWCITKPYMEKVLETSLSVV